jgi:hypothetical protein
MFAAHESRDFSYDRENCIATFTLQRFLPEAKGTLSAGRADKIVKLAGDGAFHAAPIVELLPTFKPYQIGIAADLS